MKCLVYKYDTVIVTVLLKYRIKMTYEFRLRSPEVNIFVWCTVDVPGGEQVPELDGEAGGGGGGHLRGCRGGADTAGHGGGTGEVCRLHCTKVDLFKVKVKIYNLLPLFVAFVKISVVDP